MNYYNEIKQELINNEVYKRVKDYSKNRNDLNTYYNVGKLIVEAQGGESRSGYGNKLIKEYSKKLIQELGRGYSQTNLKHMRQFYIYVKKGHPVGDQLTWSHYKYLIPIKDDNIINYYINQVIKYNLSKRELADKIKSKEYERLDNETKEKLIKKEDSQIMDLTKNPILVRNNHNYKEISEKILKQLILEDIEHFLKELGEGFCYIDNEYKIKIGDRYNYIDLLLFNYKFNCFVVAELKVTELRKEHIGQIEVYMNYIDKHIKSINQDKTIGIIICKKDNKFVMEYCSDERIYKTTYQLV